MRQYADIFFTDARHSAPQRLAFKFESEMFLLNPKDQVEPVYIVKTDISKIVAFLGAI
jgi:hypothetical protein